MRTTAPVTCALLFRYDDARRAAALRHAQDAAEVVHVLDAVAEDDEAPRAAGYDLFQIGVGVFGDVGDDALMAAGFALPLERAGVGELHADILFARQCENAPGAALGAALHEKFVYLFIRFQKFENGVPALYLHCVFSLRGAFTALLRREVRRCGRNPPPDTESR